MPCGFVLPAARLNTADADWLPLVRLAAAVYWNTWSRPASTIQISEGFDGSRVMPVGLVFVPLMVQLPTSAPESVYLKTLSVLASLTTHRCVPSQPRPTAGPEFTRRLHPHTPPPSGTLRIHHPSGHDLRLDRETLDLSADAQRVTLYLPADEATADTLARLQADEPRAPHLRLVA